MANDITVNSVSSDFRFTDATERQLLRQMVAKEQASFHPLIVGVNYIGRKLRSIVDLWMETVDTMEEVSRTYPNATQRYL